MKKINAICTMLLAAWGTVVMVIRIINHLPVSITSMHLNFWWTLAFWVINTCRLKQTRCSTFPSQSHNQRTSTFLIFRILVTDQLNMRTRRVQWKRLNQMSIIVTIAERLLDTNVPSRFMSTLTLMHFATNAPRVDSRSVIALHLRSMSEYTPESERVCYL